MGGYRLQQTVTVVRSKLQTAVIRGRRGCSRAEDDNHELSFRESRSLGTKPWNDVGTLSSQLPHRPIQPLERQRIHTPTHELPHHPDRLGEIPLALGHWIEPHA